MSGHSGAFSGRCDSLDVSVVLPQRLIDRIADTPPVEPADLARIEGMRRWRLQAFGPAIVSALKS